MADDLKKNPNENSGEQRQGNKPEQQRDQADPSKKQPSQPGHDLDQEQDNQQDQGGQRRAS